jgi:hypothetical protein
MSHDVPFRRGPVELAGVLIATVNPADRLLLVKVSILSCQQCLPNPNLENKTYFVQVRKLETICPA